MPYLVDGNNLAHALGLEIGGLADREGCALRVGEFCRCQGAQATIVFDGPAPPGMRTGASGPRTRIVFGEGRAADDVILRLVSDSRSPRDFTVVTSDKSLGDKARHRGASVLRAHEFARRLDRRAAPAVAVAEKQGRPETPEQIEAWLALFDPQRK